MQTMTASRRCNQAVIRCNDFTSFLGRCGQFTPGMRRFPIERKNTGSIITIQSLQPALQNTFAFTVFEKLNALGDLANRDHTDKQIII